MNDFIINIREELVFIDSKNWVVKINKIGCVSI